MTPDDPRKRQAGLSHLLDDVNGGATTATLASIVARARRRRERHMKIITGVSIVVALAGAERGGNHPSDARQLEFRTGPLRWSRSIDELDMDAATPTARFRAEGSQVVKASRQRRRRSFSRNGANCREILRRS